MAPRKPEFRLHKSVVTTKPKEVTTVNYADLSDAQKLQVKDDLTKMFKEELGLSDQQFAELQANSRRRTLANNAAARLAILATADSVPDAPSFLITERERQQFMDGEASLAIEEEKKAAIFRYLENSDDFCAPTPVMLTEGHDSAL